MAEAAETLGLTSESAALLTQQTILGAAHLMRESHESPDELRRRVMSPGGTTEAAIHHLEDREVRRHITEAIQAAAERSRQLGQ
jgi:pyrroline-5-carboxylate reductase